MILRKPYAFFIKHFKLFNIILTVLEVFIIYKLGFLISFFLKYSSNPIGAIGQDLTGALFNKLVFIFNVIIIIFSIILIMILSRKNKPTKLYIGTIVINIFLLVLFIITYNTLSSIQIKVIEIRVAYAIRDFLIIGMIAELLLTILTCMRSIGFDIKSFSFGKDLEELQIEVSDDEEFELQIDVDSSKLQRNLNKNKRYFKYFIYENKFMIILIFTILLGAASFFIYSKMGIYFNGVKTNKVVNIDNFMIGFKDGYITTEDYKGNRLSKDKTLVVVPFQIKTNSVKETLTTVRFQLVVNGKKYYHIDTYAEKIKDLGEVYKKQLVTKDFTTYLLVFEIPNSEVNKKKYIQYNALNDKNVAFSLSLKNVDNVNKTITNNIGETVEFKNRLIEDGNLIINSIELGDKFRVDYNFCISDNECYNSHEYIVPSFKSNYDKTVLKITGEVNLTKTNINITNLYDFIDRFGSITYTIDGKTKRQLISFVRIRPQKTNLKNVYYIEVLDEIKNADSITLEFNNRDILYQYKLK